MEESPFSKNENDGARLLEEIVALIRRFIVVSEAGAIVAAVWVLHTYSFQASDHTPYLFLRSAKGTCNLQVLDPQWTRVRVVKDCRTSDLQMMEAISLLRRGVRRERQRPLYTHGFHGSHGTSRGHRPSAGSDGRSRSGCSESRG